MSRKLFCDRCGIESTNFRSNAIIWEKDFCLDCSDRLKKFLNKFMKGTDFND